MIYTLQQLVSFFIDISRTHWLKTHFILLLFGMNSRSAGYGHEQFKWQYNNTIYIIYPKKQITVSCYMRGHHTYDTGIRYSRQKVNMLSVFFLNNYSRKKSSILLLFKQFFFFWNMTSFGNKRRCLATTARKHCFAKYVLHLVVPGVFPMFLALMYSAIWALVCYV